MLDVVSSLVHLKLKYKNLHEELVTIDADIEVEKKIYQDLQKDQR